MKPQAVNQMMYLELSAKNCWNKSVACEVLIHQIQWPSEPQNISLFRTPKPLQASFTLGGEPLTYFIKKTKAIVLPQQLPQPRPFNKAGAHVLCQN